ncbi:LexA DNA binding domain-containing protein [Comamonas sp. JUb58]|nr:LexA DNA binding domain-containing protein [Comamonas sp. JUb58]
MTLLPPRQMDVLNFMLAFHAENDQLPPKAEIARHFGFRSPNAAQCHVDALERKGFLERNRIGNLRFARGGKCLMLDQKEVGHDQS